MWRCEFKEKTAQLTLLYCGRTFRSRDWRCAIKKPVLKNLAISTGNTCVGDTQVFSCKFCKIFNTTYFENKQQTASF